tara:strand:+ start:4619 stop:5437 length:819 start_codon:yes stop_codon:yes gene_type:complete
MRTTAVYRVLYGEDFIEKSIRSLYDHVDEVVVFWTDKPWGDPRSVMYKGDEIQLFYPFDGILTKLYKLQERMPKLTVIYDYFPTPKGQHQHLVELLPNPTDVVVFVEPDMVFAPNTFRTIFKYYLDPDVDLDGSRVLACRQIELWKNFDWRIPYRDRPGPIFYDLNKYTDKKLPPTEFNGLPVYGPVQNHIIFTYNFGFCVSSSAMYWKHMTALAFSKIIGDSQPAEDWYETKWMNWVPETTDLEISENHRHLIPKAEPFDMPENMKDYMNG